MNDKLPYFANAMYKKKSLNYVNKNVGGGWELDKVNSKVDSKVFVKDNNVVIAFRGTSNLKDVKDDISIVTGRENKNKRWKKARKLVDKMNDKYEGYKIYITGHSLGSSLAEFSTRRSGNETVGFSRGTIKRRQAIKNDNYTDVYNRYDPISTSVGSHKGGNKKVVKVDGWNKHSMINFV